LPFESILKNAKKFHTFSDKTRLKTNLTESRNPSEEIFDRRINEEVIRIVVECGWAKTVARMVPLAVLKG